MRGFNRSAIVLQIYNNTDKGPNGSFQLEKFFQTYYETLDCLQHQKEAAQIYLKKLNDHKMEACNTLQQIQHEESINSNQIQNDNFLQIEVFEAKELNLNPHEQVYVRINCENVTVNTNLVPYTNTARWNEKFKIPIKTGLENISIILMTKSSASSARILGSIQIPITSLKDQQLQDKWFYLNYNKTSSTCNKVRFGLQWIYSKTLYLQSTIEKLNEHIRIQLEDVEEFEKELHELDNLIPLVIIDPTPKDQSGTSFNSDHLSPKRLNFETDIDAKKNDKVLQQCSPNLLFKPPIGAMLSANKTLIKPLAQAGSPIIKMTLPVFDQQCSQDQIRSMPNSPRLFPEKENKLTKPEGQPYLKKIFNISSAMTSPSQSTRTVPDSNELPQNENKQKFDITTQENQKLKLIIEELRRENEILKQEKNKVSPQVSSYESKIHMLVDEVERLSRTVADKNKEIEILKIQNENLNKEKITAQELENKVKEVVQENMKLNELLIRKTKEANLPKEKLEQDENQASLGIGQRKKEIFSVGPKFLNNMDRSRLPQSQPDLQDASHFNKAQGPLQTRENVPNFPVQQSASMFGFANQKISYRNGPNGFSK